MACVCMLNINIKIKYVTYKLYSAYEIYNILYINSRRNNEIFLYVDGNDK